MNAAFGLRPPFFAFLLLAFFFAIENLPDRCALDSAGGWWIMVTTTDRLNSACRGCLCPGNLARGIFAFFPLYGARSRAVHAARARPPRACPRVATCRTTQAAPPRGESVVNDLTAQAHVPAGARRVAK